MADPQTAATLATALADGLIWPGDERHGATPIPTPMFRPDPNGERAEHHAREAGLPHANFAQIFAEGIVYALERAGKRVIDSADHDRLKALDAAADAHRKREIALECVCGAQLVRSAMTEVNASKFRVQGNRLIAAVHDLSPECAVAHQGPAPQ